uniref:Uncharacterized protein n=1 Tax=Tanacetum cinerariifolium TaxID=118510 RepID=A0A6L2JS20_TANCI|nr:hypothetical protein [Tanacetum cinerariifolium]
MASAIICLAANQKFNFSKYIFDNIVKYLDGGVKFLMYLRFVQVFLNNQVEGMDRHSVFFVIFSHTKKVFAIMKREGKDFSRKVTPLFATIMKKQELRRKQRKEIDVPLPSSKIPTEKATTSNDPLPSAKTAQAKEIVCLKMKVKTLELKRKSRTSGLKRLRKGRMNEEDMFGVNDLNGDEVIIDVTVGENVELSTKVAKKEDELTLAQTLIVIKAAKHKAITTAATTVTVVGTRTKGKRIVIKDQIMIDEEFAKNLEAQIQAELEKEERLVRLKEEETNIALMLFNNTMKWIEAFVPMDTELVKSNEKAAKDNEKAAEDSEKAEEELKRCLEIIPEDDDDVIIKATPLSSKSLTIFDYKIYKEGKKSYSKIIRADGNYQSYLAFGKLFKNINREDLEVLWSIVKARFKKIKPIDDMDNLLFQTLKNMFKHHVEDNILKYQQGSVKVLHWKLFDSCGVHCITTKNIVYYLLVEKMYLFTRNFLHQMWNDVRLQVDYEVEMAYNLHRLIRKQINEGYEAK